MTCNVGNTDRLLRLIAGGVIGGTGVYFHSWWGVIGVIPLATALFRFCPAYTLIGLNTGKKSVKTANATRA